MHRRIGSAVLTAVAASVLTAPADAWSAVGYEIRTEPQRPVVGQEALITVSTTVFGTGQNGATPEPFPMPEFPWEFVADAPSGTRHTIALTPVDTSQSEWSATFTFDETGDWEIGLHPRHLVQPPDPALGARTTVTVLSSTSHTLDGSPILLAFAVAAGVLAILGLIAQRRRSIHTHDIGEP